MINPSDVPPMPDPDPIPLTDRAEIPPFPVDSLPKPIADKVRAVAEATQTDPAMAGTSALSALSACTGGHAGIEIRQGWQEPLNIYTATIADPGERKSAVQLSMVRPIHEVERQLAEKGAAARRDDATRKRVAEKSAEKLENEAAKAYGTDGWADALSSALSAKEKADEINVAPEPRIVADDATPEAVGSLLAEQGGSLAIISAEGGVLDIIAGRYSGAITNMDVWLKGHAGDPMRVDRKGRDTEHIESPALTLGLMIQPSVLTSIAGRSEFRGRGLLARFLYARPTSKVGSRKVAATPVSETVTAAYETSVRDLASGLRDLKAIPTLKLSPDAHKAMIQIETAIEPTLAGEGELASLADWGAKYAGAIARIAGIIHLAEHGSDKGPKTPVTAVTILAASRIGAYFKANAVNAFAEMGTDQGTADAVYLLDRIDRLHQSELSERDMHVATKSRFKKKDDLIPVIARLVDNGYLIPLPIPEPISAGRPASPRYRVWTTEQKEHKEQN